MGQNQPSFGNIFLLLNLSQTTASTSVSKTHPKEHLFVTVTYVVFAVILESVYKLRIKHLKINYYCCTSNGG